jgi:nitrogen fixation NifU-like protein
MSATMPSQEDLRELYRELILDHARSPRHFGKMDNPSRTAQGINPLCGDKLKLYLQLDGADRIEDIKFEGSGCAISVASASLLAETVAGLGLDESLALAAAVVAAITGESDVVDLGKLAALRGVREFPARVKCATLAWHALQAAINQDQEPATTE